MRRWSGPLILAFALWLAAVAAQAQKPETKQLTPFTFLHITDTYQTANGSAEALRKLVEDATKMSPPPAFIVATGDITEAGRPEEYARFKEAISGLEPAGIHFYAVPGSHDVRWSPDGKESFTAQFGKLYQSFDYGGAHFVLLDTTVYMEHWGHLDKGELDWLARDLKRVNPDTPVVLFMHHWIGRDVPSARLVDNEFDLVPLLRGHNVIAIFTGHGHQDLTWKTNGITAVMTRGLTQGSYDRVSVTPSTLTIDRIVKEKPTAIHVATVPLVQRARPSLLRVTWDDPDLPFLERRRPLALLDPRAIADNPDQEQAHYRLDDGDWKPMTKDARDIWRDQFYTRTIPVGVHAADIRLTTSNNITYEDELIFEVERPISEPIARKWAVNLDNSIQSSPLLANGLLYVSSLDGRIYALELTKGKKRWFYATKGPILASPLLATGMLYFGSSDHGFYALEAETGKFRWRFDAESPLFASAAWAQGILCVGGNGKIFGLDALTGQPRWTQPVGSFFQSQVATDGDTFYLGGWDNTLYALEALTGKPRWTVRLGRANGGSGVPAVSNGRIYICSNDGVLHALNARTGQEVWTATAPAGDDRFGTSSPVVVGLTIYIGGAGEHGDVYALETANGKLRWRAPTGQTICDSAPKLAPDGASLAILGVRGRVSVLDTATGRRLWGYELGPGNIFSTPEYDGSTVYTTTMANDVQALASPNAGAVPHSERAEEKSKDHS